jgi:hypothetical protein
LWQKKIQHSKDKITYELKAATDEELAKTKLMNMLDEQSETQVEWFGKKGIWNIQPYRIVSYVTLAKFVFGRIFSSVYF